MQDDLPPERFRNEAVKSGPYKGARVEADEFNRMLDEYYELWDMDRDTGWQKRSTLERLGLGDVAARLEQRGKLR